MVGATVSWLLDLVPAVVDDSVEPAPLLLILDLPLVVLDLLLVPVAPSVVALSLLVAALAELLLDPDRALVVLLFPVPVLYLLVAELALLVTDPPILVAEADLVDEPLLMAGEAPGDVLAEDVPVFDEDRGDVNEYEDFVVDEMGLEVELPKLPAGLVSTTPEFHCWLGSATP